MTSARTLVPPATGRRESFAVIALVLTILAGSSVVVALHRETAAGTTLPDWQIDIRTDMNAAEQGLTADLMTAAAEIPFLPDSSPAALSGEGIQPFVTDATARARGGHVWQQLAGENGQRAWLGLPSEPEVARAVLLRLEGDLPTIWLHDDAGATAPALDDAALIAAGWRQVALRFDTSVTREDQH